MWLVSGLMLKPSQTRRLTTRLASAMLRLAHGDAGAGLILLGAAIAALLAANSALAHTYHAVLHDPLGWTPVAALPSLHYWINDALMAVFFFVIGLEIKREVLAGELASAARRRLPVLAAMAGMAVPALVYLAITGGSTPVANVPPLANGWAIPAATDIAFAVGILALAGKGLPPSLRLFLLTVAIVDDLGAVAIIALFYTDSISLVWLVAALSVFLVMALINRRGVFSGWAYAPLAIVLWLCVLHSGVHATVAGVLAAFTIPLAINRKGDSLLLRMEHGLVPWSAYLIVPLFGFANAGVSLAGASLASFAAPLPLAVAAGLFAGKQIGILGAILLAERSGFAPRPSGASTLHLWGLAALCGIGFTMSLFIGALAFPLAPALVEEAKLGVLAGSALAGVLGFVVLRFAPRK